MSLVGVLWCDVGAADDGSFSPFTRDLSDTDWGYQLLLDPTGFAPTEEVERFEVRLGDCSNDGDRDDCADSRERSELTERARSRKPVTGLQWYRWQVYFPDDYEVIYPARVVHAQFAQQRLGAAWVFEIGATGVLWVGNRLDEKGSYQALIDEDSLRGQWHDVVVQVDWSNKNGVLVVWVDGVRKAQFRGRTCSSCRVYFSYGIVREQITRFNQAYPGTALPTQVVYYTNMRRSRLVTGLKLADEPSLTLEGHETTPDPATSAEETVTKPKAMTAQTPSPTVVSETVDTPPVFESLPTQKPPTDIVSEDDRP